MLFAAQLNTVVCRDNYSDLLGRGLFDLEAFGIEARVQRLEADQVLELQVARRGSALAELLDHLPETIANALPRDEVVVLDTLPHVFGQEGLVTE